MTTQIKLMLLKERLGTTGLLDEILDQIEPEELDSILQEICKLWDYRDLMGE